MIRCSPSNNLKVTYFKIYSNPYSDNGEMNVLNPTV